MQETRVLLRNVGVIDPVSANANAEAGGYEALKQAMTKLKH